eukprot:364339-Chlamydomonas_euryale.AAC.9
MHAQAGPHPIATTPYTLASLRLGHGLATVSRPKNGTAQQTAHSHSSCGHERRGRRVGDVVQDGQSGEGPGALQPACDVQPRLRTGETEVNASSSRAPSSARQHTPVTGSCDDSCACRSHAHSGVAGSTTCNCSCADSSHAPNTACEQHYVQIRSSKPRPAALIVHASSSPRRHLGLPSGLHCYTSLDVWQ